MYDSVKETKVQLSQDIFPAEAWELITKNRDGDDLVIIDVSTPQEYKDLHLEGAVNVNLLSRFFKTRLDVMNKSKTYVVYCKVGGRSKIAQKLMQQFGFRIVYNVVGGTLLWEEEGLPFASGTEGVNKFSFCPFFISIVAFKKIKNVLHNGLSRIVQPTNFQEAQKYPEALKLAPKVSPDHAGKMETSLALHLCPDLAKMENLDNADGNIGVDGLSAKEASSDFGKYIFDSFVEFMVQLVNEA